MGAFQRRLGTIRLRSYHKGDEKIDPTRLIDSVSGWNDQGKGTSDTKSLHIYFKPLFVPRKDDRCYILSEFGGYAIKTEGHMYSPDNQFGYRIYKKPATLAKAIKRLYEKQSYPRLTKDFRQPSTPR